MRVFVCHSSKDEATVNELVGDLSQGRLEVWLDQQLRGGDPWWQHILRQIRECNVFLMALSTDSLASKPCLAEMEYAQALGLPILPVQVGPVSNLRVAPIADVQVLDYRERTAGAGIALVTAVHDAAQQRHDFPDPLPSPPPVPYAYLMRLRSAIEGPELPAERQEELIWQLRRRLETEDDDVRGDVLQLLRGLRQRSDVTYRNALEIDTLLGKEAASEQEPQTSSSSESNQELQVGQQAQPPVNHELKVSDLSVGAEPAPGARESHIRVQKLDYKSNEAAPSPKSKVRTVLTILSLCAAAATAIAPSLTWLDFETAGTLNASETLNAFETSAVGAGLVQRVSGVVALLVLTLSLLPRLAKQPGLSLCAYSAGLICGFAALVSDTAVRSVASAYVSIATITLAYTAGGLLAVSSATLLVVLH